MDAQHPTPIAVAVVRRGDSVLIGRRAKDVPLAGYWEFPGGKVLPGESAPAAAVRECFEEAGIRIQAVGSCATVEYRYGHGLVRIEFIESRIVAPEVTPQSPFRWIPLAELDEYRFPPANAKVLEWLKASR